MKTFFVSYISESESLVIEERIKSLGDYYAYSRNQYFVSSCYESADQVYSAIAKTDFTKMSILVIAVNTIVQQGYWGVEKKELWNWLEKHKSL